MMGLDALQGFISTIIRGFPPLSSVIPAKAGIHVIVADDRRPQVTPPGVRLFYQVYLPSPVPLLELFLPPYRFVDVDVNLEVDQAMNPVAFRESFDEVAAMFPDPFDEIGGHSSKPRRKPGVLALS